MKSRVLAAFLSVAIVFSSIPAMDVSANPVTSDTVAETMEETVAEEETPGQEEDADQEESTIEETMVEESTEAEASTEEESSAVEETTLEEETTEEDASEVETTTEELIVEEPSAESDETVKAVGSNGIAYENVTYLSYATVNALSSDSQSFYYEMCDTLAYLYDCGIELKNVVFTADDEAIRIRYTTPVNELFSEVGQESTEGVEINPLSLLIDEEHFKNQLNTDAQGLYNAGKQAMVDGGSNSFTLTYQGRKSFDTEHLDALSALINTYPNKFNWMDLGSEGGFTALGIYYQQSKKTVWSFEVAMSKYYSSSLEQQANKKAKELAKEAYQYAQTNYPDSPTYGMIKYFNDWICTNSYYDMVGVDGPKDSKQYFFCHSCYGVLLKGYGVCESYALTMTRLLDAAGIRNMYVKGSVKEDGQDKGHAWNYVQMSNGNWYLVDPTWNDSVTDDESLRDDYLLVKDSGVHCPEGRRFATGIKFKFCTLAITSFIPGIEESMRMNKSETFLKPGKSVKLKVGAVAEGNYYGKYKKTWSSSNKKVATVDKEGKVTTKAPGVAAITCDIAGKKVVGTVYVYKVSGLKFNDNNKSTYTWNYVNPTDSFANIGPKSVSINVVQQNESVTASRLASELNLEIKAKSNKKSVAEVGNVSMIGNTISVSVVPKAIGTAQITVTFAEKQAVLTVKNTRKIEENWFDFSAIENVVYTGTAFKPKVKKSEAAPKNLKYTVSYENNKNAGTATVTIKGNGNYGGEIKKYFKIEQKDFTSAVIKSCKTSVTYNAKEQSAAPKIKVGSTVLKAGTDYDVYYSNSLNVPMNVGEYTLRFVGKGNYKGELKETRTFVINPASIKMLKVTCPETVKYTGASVTLKYKVKLGNNLVPESDYTVTYLDKDQKKLAAIPSAKGTYMLVITPKGKNIITEGNKVSITRQFKIK